jgi:hypothetical protein
MSVKCSFSMSQDPPALRNADEGMESRAAPGANPAHTDARTMGGDEFSSCSKGTRVAAPGAPPPSLVRPPRSSTGQGLTLVHFSAQLEPCLTHRNTLNPIITPSTRATQPLRALPIPYKALKLSRKVDECKPLPRGPQPACCRGGWLWRGWRPGWRRR